MHGRSRAGSNDERVPDHDRLCRPRSDGAILGACSWVPTRGAAGPASDLGEYWVSVGVPEDEADDGYDSLVDPDGRRPRIWFQRVPEAKEVKIRLHFHLLVGGGRGVPLDQRKQRVLAEGERLSRSGATERLVMDSPEFDHFLLAMADPEGNEFDIV